MGNLAGIAASIGDTHFTMDDISSFGYNQAFGALFVRNLFVIGSNCIVPYFTIELSQADGENVIADIICFILFTLISQFLNCS